MTTDWNRPPPLLPLCPNGHVACIEAEDANGDRWCWGWHLVAYEDEWEAIVCDGRHMECAVERLAFMLASHGVNLAGCTWTGRGLTLTDA